jgi:hypothetical protein
LTLWGVDVDFVVRFESPHCVVLEHVCNNKKVYIMGIYASINYLHRRQLWSNLTALQQSYLVPWIFVGDFNAVLGAHEKRGTRLPASTSCNEFLSWMS